jgi:hypothetical protein
MDKESFKDKTIGEIISDETAIMSRFTEDELKTVKDQKLLSYGVTRDNDIAVLSDYSGLNVVVVFVNGRPKALFYIYELHGVIVNAKRNFVLAYGHEDIKIYWINDGELTEIATR